MKIVFQEYKYKQLAAHLTFYLKKDNNFHTKAQIQTILNFSVKAWVDRYSIMDLKNEFVFCASIILELCPY